MSYIADLLHNRECLPINSSVVMSDLKVHVLIQLFECSLTSLYLLQFFKIYVLKIIWWKAGLMLGIFMVWVATPTSLKS